MNFEGACTPEALVWTSAVHMAARAQCPEAGIVGSSAGWAAARHWIQRSGVGTLAGQVGRRQATDWVCETGRPASLCWCVRVRVEVSDAATMSLSLLLTVSLLAAASSGACF